MEGKEEERILEVTESKTLHSQRRERILGGERSVGGQRGGLLEEGGCLWPAGISFLAEETAGETDSSS